MNKDRETCNFDLHDATQLKSKILWCSSDSGCVKQLLTDQFLLNYALAKTNIYQSQAIRRVNCKNSK